MNWVEDGKRSKQQNLIVDFLTAVYNLYAVIKDEIIKLLLVICTRVGIEICDAKQLVDSSTLSSVVHSLLFIKKFSSL